MDMIIDFPAGSRVDAPFGPYTIATDQAPVASAPSPFEIFLASIGTCARIYLLGFCQQPEGWDARLADGQAAG